MAYSPNISAVPPDLRPRTPAPAPPPIAPRVAPPPDPLAPLTPQQIQAKASAAVGAEVNPVLAQLKALFASRSQQGQAAITGYTRSLAGDLGQYMDRAKAAYGQAQQDQNAVDSAVSSELHGGGSKVAAALTSRLGEGFDPAMVQALADKANATGAGSAGAQYAQGSAELSKLIGEGAHAEEYAGKLPGLAALTGLQGSKQLQAQLDSELATQAGDVASKVPGAVESLVQGMQGTELQKALARQSGLFNQQKQKAEASYRQGETSYRQQTLRQRQAAANAAARTAATRAGIAQQNANTAATRVNNSAAAAQAAATAKAAATQAAAKKPDASLSRTYGYVVDSNGKPILRGGKPVPVSKTSAAGATKGPLGLSAKDYQKFWSLAQGAARNYHGTWQDKTGANQQPLTWQQYLTHGEMAGIPVAILIKAGKGVYSNAERAQGLVPPG